MLYKVFEVENPIIKFLNGKTEMEKVTLWQKVILAETTNTLNRLKR